MKLSLETFSFLSDLKLNNQRDWFNANKDIYLRVKEGFEAYVDGILSTFTDQDPNLIGLTGKKATMRIYRDVRFSVDKSPYKTNIGASFHNPNHKGNFPGYFLSIGPKESFLAGGYWMPEASLLKAIRQEIDYNPEKFMSIINDKSFKNLFGGLSEESKLRSLPKAYKDYIDPAVEDGQTKISSLPHLEVLKLKSFTASFSLTEEELLSDKGFDKILIGLKALIPFINFLREVK